MHIPKLGRIAMLLMFVTAACWGQLIDDPLHGYCSGSGQCVDNGTNSSTSENPITGFGFTVSPGPASGDLLVDVLVPGNEQVAAASYAITQTLGGAAVGTATLVSTTDWTSGDLGAYLGLSASPNNPIGAYLPSTQGLDPTASGFSVYQVNVGSLTLQGPSNPDSSPLWNITALPKASYIVGFLNEGTAGSPDWIATANSGAIFETSSPPASVPEPSSVILLGTMSLFVLIGAKKALNRW